ncbi:MAG: HD domain-containing protein [Clostridia bacterium]|nr:HD domain-containing protein [Clostridia bacterium]
MAFYETLSKELTERMEQERANNTHVNVAFDERNAVRRIQNPHDAPTVWRPAFIRDVDKILNCPYYNRYTDKTQVFSLYKNDDITHRSLHVQLVSRIARTIGRALRLNLDLIEAIALGHDIGHTPFGHAGERFLDELYAEHTGRRFSHNIHSVRVLDEIFPLNISLQTLDGISAHNGELELDEYRPAPLKDFAVYDKQIEACYLDQSQNKKLLPSTLEGCVVRISDIIAYLGKDRKDAETNKLLTAEAFQQGGIGVINAEIVNNLMVNIIENSYGKPYIKMDKAHFNALQQAKRVNYEIIYGNKQVKEAEGVIRVMMSQLYEKLLADLTEGNTASPVFTHHIEYLNKPYYKRRSPYAETEKNRIVADYIASMTDDYFIDLHAYLFPQSKLHIQYVGYFD